MRTHVSDSNDPYDPKQVAALLPDELDGCATRRSPRSPPPTDLDALAAGAHRPSRGRSPPVALARRELGALPPQARADAGRRRQRGADRASRPPTTSGEAELDRRSATRGCCVEEAVDVTLPTDRRPAGARHPLTAGIRAGRRRLRRDGLGGRRGPRGRAEWFNFDALNIPPAHPARETQDTLCARPRPTAGGVVLRTHTSAGADPRRCSTAARRVTSSVPAGSTAQEALDATHSPVFHQVEGLAVDEGLTMADLRGTLDASPRRCSGPGCGPGCGRTTSRSPSRRADVDLQCCVCRGDVRSRQPCRGLPVRGLDRVGRQRHGQPGRAAGLRGRPAALHRLRVRHGSGAHADVRHDIGDIRDLVEGDVRFTVASAWRADARPDAWLRDNVDCPACRRPARSPDALTGPASRSSGSTRRRMTSPASWSARCSRSRSSPGSRSRSGSAWSMSATAAEPRGIICGARNFAVGRPGRVRAARAVLPGGFAIAARQDLRPHLRRHDLLGARAGDRRRPRRHPDPRRRTRGRSAPTSMRLTAATTSSTSTSPPTAATACRCAGSPARSRSRSTWTSSIRSGPSCRPPTGRGPRRAHRGSDGLRPVRRPGDPWRSRPDCAGSLGGARRLSLAGMRPISLVVDVTNYVMLELGQPLHAFDLAELTGDIVVRRAACGGAAASRSTASTARSTPTTWSSPTTSGPIALAGVMGGAAHRDRTGRPGTSCWRRRTSTRSSVARTARRHRLPSEASRRFERGVDDDVAPAALDAAAQLLGAATAPAR